MYALGSIRGSFIKSKFVLNYSEDRKQYEFQRGSKFGKTYQEVFENVKTEIVKLIKAGAVDDYGAIESNRLSPMFKGKIYYIYFPEKTMPIYNVQHIRFFARALGINCTFFDRQVDMLQHVLLHAAAHKIGFTDVPDFNDFFGHGGPPRLTVTFVVRSSRITVSSGINPSTISVSNKLAMPFFTLRATGFLSFRT